MCKEKRSRTCQWLVSKLMPGEKKLCKYLMSDYINLWVAFMKYFVFIQRMHVIQITGTILNKASAIKAEHNDQIFTNVNSCSSLKCYLSLSTKDISHDLIYKCSNSQHALPFGNCHTKHCCSYKDSKYPLTIDCMR